jgi:branched-chain amino acid transport system ATP-binding protein
MMSIAMGEAPPLFSGSPEPLLSVEKLEVVYQRAITAVQGISLAVPQGQIVGILGTNGAGKTTLLRAISGFHGIDDARVTEGSIRFKGRAIENGEPHRIARAGIAIVPERDKAFPNLTVAENLAVPAGPPGERAAERRRREEQLAHFFPRLGDLRHRTAGLLSGGERQMLAIASALVCRPELLLVDELSLGLAPVVVVELMGRLVQIKRELGITVMLVEQSAAVALDVADYSYVLENGRIVLDGDSARLRDHPDIQEFYLGQASGGGARRSYRDVKQYRRSRRWYG